MEILEDKASYEEKTVMMKQVHQFMHYIKVGKWGEGSGDTGPYSVWIVTAGKQREFEIYGIFKDQETASKEALAHSWVLGVSFVFQSTLIDGRWVLCKGETKLRSYKDDK